MQFLRGLKSLDGFVKTKADSVARKRTLCGAIREPTWLGGAGRQESPRMPPALPRPSAPCPPPPHTVRGQYVCDGAWRQEPPASSCRARGMQTRAQLC